MFQENRGAPLWAHVAGGVAVGGIVAGVVLYALWLWHARVVMEQVSREWQRSTAAVLREGASVRVPPPRVPAAASSPAQSCPRGYARGVLNDVAVCVSPTGQVVDVVK